MINPNHHYSRIVIYFKNKPNGEASVFHSQGFKTGRFTEQHIQTQLFRQIKKITGDWEGKYTTAIIYQNNTTPPRILHKFVEGKEIKV